MRIMRHTYNTWLPVEIFSFPGETCPPELVPEIEKLGGRMRILSTLHKDPSRVKNWVRTIKHIALDRRELTCIVTIAAH